MLRFFLVLFTMISLLHLVSGQGIIYLHIRDSLANISCGNYDRDANLQAILQLEEFNVSLLGKNINLYYEDLAICYWKEAHLKDEILLHKGIKANLAALYYKSDSPRALSGLILCYSALKKCPEAMYYLERLRKSLPKKKWDEDMEKFVESSCD